LLSLKYNNQPAGVGESAAVATASFFLPRLCIGANGIRSGNGGIGNDMAAVDLMALASAVARKV
jgi:hypothetical protein